VIKQRSSHAYRMGLTCSKHIGIAILSCFLSLTTAWAQIATDGSLGPAQTLAGPNYVISEDLGRRVGTNLFHSFREFSINPDLLDRNPQESATFTGASDITNIISRVTGGTESVINGPLRSEIPNANFFLINSAGIVFGRNASLSIDGSFHGSTADYTRLGDDGLFYSEPLRGDILSTAAPKAFGFFGPPKGQITLASSKIELEEGATFSLVGAEINIDPANIDISEGQINLVSVGSKGEAVFDKASGYQDLNVDTFEQLNTVNILKGSKLNVAGERGGRVVIRGGQMVLSDSVISAQTTGDSTGKGIDIKGDQLRFVNSRIDTTTTDNGTAGDILIDTDTLVLNGTGSSEKIGVFANASIAQGNAGTITMTADQVDVFGNLAIEATAELPANTGTIHLSPSTLKWNDFDAEFQVNVDTGKVELVRFENDNIVLDGSLNPMIDEVVLEGPDYQIESDMGKIAGNNLFHSFKVFFLDEGETASFSSTEPVSNIIARVTGDAMTSIYGELIVDDTLDANLYFFNPNGLFFGADAVLNLPGSFHAGTADYLSFAGGGRFDSRLSETSVLDDNRVSAYGFADSDIGNIDLDGARLIISSGKVISLIGGNLSLRNGSRVATGFGHVNLVSLKSEGEAFVMEDSNDLDVSKFNQFGDITLFDDAAVNVRIETNNTSSKGRIYVRGRHLTMDNDGELRARNFNGGGGSMYVVLRGDLFIRRNSGIEISGGAVIGQAVVEAENITIDGTGQSGLTGIEVTARGEVLGNNNTTVRREEINLTLIANETLSIVNGGIVNAFNLSEVSGTNATIKAKNLIISRGSSNTNTGVFSQVTSRGNGGELNISVEERLLLDDGIINSSTESFGDGGNITIDSKSLTIENRGIIVSAATLEPGSDFQGSNITGNGGELDILVEEELKIASNGQINTETFVAGNAGKIKLQAKDLIINGQPSGFTGIRSTAQFGSTGNGGDIDVVAENRIKINLGAIGALSERRNAGNLRISAGSDVQITNSELNISAGQETFNLNDLGSFQQPELVIEAGNSIYIENSILTTAAGTLGSGRGAGGNIRLLAPTEIRLIDSALFAQAGYSGGNVFIDPQFYIVINSDVNAQADFQGGNYSVVVTQPAGWIQSANSLINLSGQQSGAVLSNSSPFDLGAELVDLDTNFLNASDWTLQPCNFRLGGAGSSFVVTGWRGVSDNPDDFLPSEPILLADYNYSEAEPISDQFLQEAMFPELKDGCDDCP